MSTLNPSSQELAPTAAQTTRDNPWPLRLLTSNIKTYVDRMSTLWVEGQVVQYSPRPGTKMAFFTLRDSEADTSMTVTAFPGVIDRVGPAFEAGARVVARVKPVFWERGGQLNLQASEIHTVGLGDLLAQVERLRRTLQDEGLFDPAMKKPLPFLPRRIGLVCGRNAKAKDDVLVNANARWPGISWEIREVAVQGVNCVREVSTAIVDLDAIADVDVIVVARGGGAVEELLPFSDEVLVRTAAAASTPLVSAIGHEGDAPLLDLVADFRASTPTDAAKNIVPDWSMEDQRVSNARAAIRTAVSNMLATASAHLDAVTAHPVLSQPAAVIDSHRQVIDSALTSMRYSTVIYLNNQISHLDSAHATLTAMSPQATLNRGYSLIRLPDGSLARSAEMVPVGTRIDAVLASGRLNATVTTSVPAPTA